jgi:hypothetical protein
MIKLCWSSPSSKVPCRDKIRHDEVPCRGVTRTVAGNILLDLHIAAVTLSTALRLYGHSTQSASGAFFWGHRLRTEAQISFISRQIHVPTMTLTTTRMQPLPTADKSSPKTTKPEHAQAQSMLFRLPHEIRHLIFLLALAKPLSTTLLDSSHDDRLDVEPALLSTCHRVRAEALPLFYSTNDWVIKTRRVGGDAGRLDPISKRLITYQCIPRWLDVLPDDKIALIRSIVAIGSRGSYVDFKGKWWDGDRVAFRLQKLNGLIGYCVDEVDCHDEELVLPTRKKEKEAFCSIHLVDLLNARMRINARTSRNKWLWTKQRLHDLAFLL